MEIHVGDDLAWVEVGDQGGASGPGLKFNVAEGLAHGVLGFGNLIQGLEALVDGLPAQSDELVPWLWRGLVEEAVLEDGWNVS